MGAVLVKWETGRDTAVAFATVPAMIAVYFVNSHLDPANIVVRLLVFVVVGSLCLNVLLPAYYVLRVRGEPLSELGITTRHWQLALLVSVAVALVHLPGLLSAVARHADINLVPHLVFNSLILWEPFFVYGWLQIRFERAFGVLPGILLSALSFAGYHVGTFAPEQLPTLLVWGTFDGVVFRLTRNLLSLFPIPWAVASGSGMLMGDMVAGWDAVAVYAIVLPIQIAALVLMVRSQPRGLVSAA